MADAPRATTRVTIAAAAGRIAASAGRAGIGTGTGTATGIAIGIATRNVASATIARARIIPATTMLGIVIGRPRLRRGRSRLRVRAPISRRPRKAIRSPGAAGGADAAVAVDDRTRTSRAIRSRLRRAMGIHSRGTTRPACPGPR